MSLYNMVHGHNPAARLCLHVLGIASSEIIPRFRDAWIFNVNEKNKSILPDLKVCIYTRTGGGNRAEYAVENQAIRDLPGFLWDEDDDYDSTFAKWYFEVPEEYKAPLLEAYRKVGDQLSSRERWENMIKGIKPDVKE